ncbi:MAG TPA: prepilin peptidase [Gemmatimonadales bacterium]|nr:prepilin peptidase [Gemmatimonadales bacterium]
MDVTEPVLAVFAGIWGAMLGSFLNVCVWRLPRNESVIRPASHCPACGKPIAWYDNIPLLSYVALRARCRHCGARISAQYPLVELAVALIWAGAVVWRGASWEALSAAVLTTLLLGIALTDARHYLIPDEFSLGGLGAGLALSFIPGGISPLDSLVGAAAGFALLWVVKAAGDWALKRGMIRGEELQQVLEAGETPTTLGGGDLKMMAMVGSFLGWRGVLLTAFLGSVAGVLVFLPLVLLKRRSPIPFGVFLAVGAVVTLVAGDALVAWYSGMLVSSVP